MNKSTDFFFLVAVRDYTYGGKLKRSSKCGDCVSVCVNVYFTFKLLFPPPFCLASNRNIVYNQISDQSKQSIRRNCLASYHPKMNVRGKRNEGERMEDETLKLKKEERRRRQNIRNR